MLFFEGVNTHHIWWIIKDLGQGSEWMTSQNHWGLKSKRATLSVLNNIFFLPFSSESWNSSSRDSAAPTELSSTAGGGGSWMIWGVRGEINIAWAEERAEMWHQNLQTFKSKIDLCIICMSQQCVHCVQQADYTTTHVGKTVVFLRVSSALQKPCTDLQKRWPDFFFSFCP